MKLLLNRKIKLIYPYKKNQIDKNTFEDKLGLKNRMRVEHVNNFLKQNKALNNRYDKDFLNFESLIYLGCLKLGLQIIIRDFYKFYIIILILNNKFLFLYKIKNNINNSILH